MKPLHLFLIPVLFLMMTSCKEATPTDTSVKTASFYIGTYTHNNSKGIYKAAINPEGKFMELTLAAHARNPSWLTKTKDGHFLIALSEQESGSLSSYTINGDSLKLLSTIENIGMHPCHISANKEHTIAVSNYSSGDIGIFSINKQGILVKQDTLAFTGKGPHERQEAPHAHSTEFINNKTLVTADLGTDRLWITEINSTGLKSSLSLTDSMALPAGAGPRHLVMHPDTSRFYVINELNSTVCVLNRDNTTGAYNIIQEITTLPDDFSGESWCAEIQLDHTGKYLYASNRGHQSLAIYEVEQTKGTLRPIGFEPVRGDWPRNFVITPDNQYLIVANERSDNLVCFKRDLSTGKLSYTDELKVPEPVCLLF